MNMHAFDIGYCGYCHTPMEDWERGHVNKCARNRKQFLDKQAADPAYQLKRIADSLEKQVMTPTNQTAPIGQNRK